MESTTELDEIFRIFDPPTRRAFREWVQEGSTVVAGDYAQDFNDALGNLAPFATDGSKLLQILDDQEIAVRKTIKHTGRVFNALAAEEGQLSGLITNGNETFEALASRDEALSQTFEVLPTFLRETRTTLRRLDRFAANTRPLVNDLKGPADDLGPTVRDLGNMAPYLTQTLKDLNPLIRASRRGLPAATRLLRGANPLVNATHTLIPELSPVLANLSYNAPSVARFLTVGGGALAADGSNSYADNVKLNEHRLPQIATIDSQSFRQLNSRPPDDRGNTYVAPNAYTRANPLGALESGDCDNVGGGQRNPNDGQVQELGSLLATGVSFRSSESGAGRYRAPARRAGRGLPRPERPVAALLRAAPVAVPGPAVQQGRAGQGQGDGSAVRHERDAAGHSMSSSRRGFLAAGGVAALALASCGGDTDRETPERGPASGDLDVVNFALVLEYFEEDFYRQVLEKDVVGGSNRGLIRQIHEHERAHVAMLEKAAEKLGRAAAPPQTSFEDVFGAGEGRTLRVALDFENTGAAAYLGQAKKVRSNAVLADALSIHSVEARHAAALADVTGANYLPDGAFATPLEPPQVMARIRPYLV